MDTNAAPRVPANLVLQSDLKRKKKGGAVTRRNCDAATLRFTGNSYWRWHTMLEVWESKLVQGGMHALSADGPVETIIMIDKLQMAPNSRFYNLSAEYKNNPVVIGV